jgi:hypothetical protein
MLGHTVWGVCLFAAYGDNPGAEQELQELQEWIELASSWQHPMHARM